MPNPKRHNEPFPPLTITNIHRRYNGPVLIYNGTCHRMMNTSRPLGARLIIDIIVLPVINRRVLGRDERAPRVVI